jgi:hypothetical protein
MNRWNLTHVSCRYLFALASFRAERRKRLAAQPRARHADGIGVEGQTLKLGDEAAWRRSATA